MVDVNRHAPVFTQPAYTERILEEQPIGTALNTYTATDRETPISAIVIYPPSPYFAIDNVTGKTRHLNIENHSIIYNQCYSKYIHKSSVLVTFCLYLYYFRALFFK